MVPITLNILKTYAGKLFSDPTPKSLGWKTAIVAFHTLTLGIPLAVYYFTDYRFPKVKETALDLKEIALKVYSDTVRAPPKKGVVQSYTRMEARALLFSRNKLKEHPEFKKRDLIDNYFLENDGDLKSLRKHYNIGMPENPEISALAGLYRHYEKQFKGWFKEGKPDPWESPEFISLVDEYVKIGFAISILTLEDLEAINKRYPIEEQSIFRTLVRQDGGTSFFTIGCGINAYRFVRDKKEWLGKFFRGRNLSEKEADGFYTQGTIQYSWNRLYNAFCDRIRMYVSEEDIHEDPRQDDRIFLSSKQDFKA